MTLTPPWKAHGAADFVIAFQPIPKGVRRKGCMDRTVNLKNNRIVGGSRTMPRVATSARYRAFRKWALPQLKQYAGPWRARHGLRAHAIVEVMVACAYRPPKDRRRRPDRDGVQTTVLDLLTEAGVYDDDELVLPLGSWMVEPEEGEDARLWIWVRPIRRVMGTYGPEYELIEERAR